MPDPWTPGRRPPPPQRARRRPRDPDLWRGARLGAFVPDDPRPGRTGAGARPRPQGRAAAAGLGLPARRRRRQATPWWERLNAEAAAELERRRAARRDGRRRAHQTLRRVRASAPRPVGLLLWWGEQAEIFRRAAAVAIGAFVVGIIVLALPILHLQRVALSGAAGLSRAAVLRASGLQQGESMIFVQPAAAERGLLRLPAVRAARVRVVFPDRVAIDLQQWTPVLVDVRAGLFAPVAPDGVAIAAARPLAALGPALTRLPRVVELGRLTPVHAGQAVWAGRYAAALAAVVSVFPRAYGVTVREFAVTAAGSLLIYASSGWVADLGPVLTPSQLAGLAPRLEALRALGTRVDLAGPGIAAIDLQDPAQVDVTDGRPAPLPAGGPPVLEARPNAP